MKKFARIDNNVALEVLTPPEGFGLSDCLHPDIAAQFSEVPVEVTPGSTRNSDGSWEIAPAPEPPEPIVEQEDKRITCLAFLQRFTLAERMAIRAARAADGVVDDFMGMVDAATYIDLDREDTEQGVGYLVTKGHVTAERAEAILTAPVQPIERPQGL